MGKLKEELLNNLSPEEFDELNQIPEDVAEVLHNETEQLENEYYEQSEIDEINDSIEIKYSDSDVIAAIRKVKNEDWFVDRVLKELNGINLIRKGYE